MSVHCCNSDNTYEKLLFLAKQTTDLEVRFKGKQDVINTLNKLEEFKAVHYRIIPLLKKKAVELGVYSELNSSIKQLLNNHTISAVIKQMASKRQLEQVLELFNKENIDVILLKGAAYADVLYEKESPRTSNDIDLLVKKEQWNKAKEAINTIMDPIEIKNEHPFDNLYESSFVPKSNVGDVIDLHSSLVHPVLFSIDEDEIWSESITHPRFNSRKVRTLSAEHSLVHQAIHAFKDMNFYKYNLVDTDRILEVFKPDLEKTKLIAKKWGAIVPLYILLDNCKQVMKSNIDNKSMKYMKPSIAALYITERLLASPSKQPINGKKTIKYRVNQILSQFVFTQSLVKPIKFQWLFIKTTLKI